MAKQAGIIEKTSVSLLRAELLQHFRTAAGEHTTFQNLIFTVTLADGTTGYGEAAVPAHFTPDEISRASRDLEQAGRALRGRDSADYLKISAELHERFPHKKAGLAAIEMALLDALTRQRQIPLWRFFGDTCICVATDITIVLGDLKEAEESVRKFYPQGFRAFKIKIGRDQDLDFQRILTVKKLAPDARVYLDGNQGYSVKETLGLLRRLDEASINIELLEQPVPRDDWDGLKEIARSTSVPVCADESLRSLSEASRAIKEKAVSVINIKFMKFGLLHAREIADLARANGVGLMIGGMLESSLAMTAAAHFAAGLQSFKYIDLDAPFFIKGENSRGPCLDPRGVYDVRAVKAGIGIIPPVGEMPDRGSLVSRWADALKAAGRSKFFRKGQ